MRSDRLGFQPLVHLTPASERTEPIYEVDLLVVAAAIIPGWDDGESLNAWVV